MIKAVIFDLWGTLAFNKNHIGSYIERINEIIGQENKEKFIELRRDWYVSRMSEEEFFTKLLKSINKPILLSEQLLKIWNSQIDSIELYKDSLDVLKLLKSRNIKLVLLSNTVPITNKCLEKLDIAKYFDIIFLSCNEGMLKPSPMIYNRILEKLKFKPEEVIAIGDQINTDITGAETYGIKAILIDRENKNNYKNKITELDEIEFYLYK